MEVRHSHPPSADWWHLYCTAFPPEERRSWSTHELAQNDAAFHATGLYHQNRFVGLMTWWEWGAMLYLEHLAIVDSERGKGYGHAALTLLKAKGGDIILEIEPVCHEQQARRLAFYQSCGFKELPYPHIQLAYQQGYPDIPLLLLGCSESGDVLSATTWELFEKRFAAGPMKYRDKRGHN